MTTTAPPTQPHATDGRTARRGDRPPYPKTERQAEFMALADRMAVVAAENAPAHDRENTFAHDSFAALRESGYLALTVPEEYGGRGATPLEMMLAQERLARGDGSVALASTMHLVVIGGLADSRAWPEPLFERVCREVVAEGALVNGVASEPDLGSPSRGGQYATLAVPAGGGWLVNGRKTWTTLSPELRYAATLLGIQAEDGSIGRGQLLILMDSPGVRIEETWDNLGMRSTGSHEVVFEDVFVPHDARLPGSANPPGRATSGWNLLGSAVYLGIAEAARDFTVRYARERRPTAVGGPIAEIPSVQHRVARMEILLFQARAALYAAAETHATYPEHREALGWQLAAAKYTVTNHAIAVTDMALRVVGSSGLQKQYSLERYFRDVRAGLGNPPIDDVALTLIGKAALGL